MAMVHVIEPAMIHWSAGIGILPASWDNEAYEADRQNQDCVEHPGHCVSASECVHVLRGNCGGATVRAPLLSDDAASATIRLRDSMHLHRGPAGPGGASLPKRVATR